MKLLQLLTKRNLATVLTVSLLYCAIITLTISFDFIPNWLKPLLLILPLFICHRIYYIENSQKNSLKGRLTLDLILSFFVIIFLLLFLKAFNQFYIIGYYSNAYFFVLSIVFGSELILSIFNKILSFFKWQIW